MAKKKREVVTQIAVKFDGEYHDPGTVLKLDAEEAEKLIDRGHAVDLADAEPDPEPDPEPEPELDPEPDE